MDYSAVIDYQRKNWVEQTQSGLLLLVVGVVLAALPIVRPVGSFVTLSAIVLIVKGRHGFGQKHSTHVVVGTIIFAIGAAFSTVASVGYVFLFLALTFDYPGVNALPLGMVQTIPSFLIVDLVGTIFLGTSYAVLTYRLQKSMERALLWLGFAINITTSVLVFFVLSSEYTSHLAPFWGLDGWDLPRAYAFEEQVVALSFLNVLPAAIYAAVFRSSYSRMNYAGEIPAA